jgi:hypothetical protein
MSTARQGQGATGGRRVDVSEDSVGRDFTSISKTIDTISCAVCRRAQG